MHHLRRVRQPTTHTHTHTALETSSCCHPQTSDAGADERSSDDVIAFVKAVLSDAQGTEGSASDARVAVKEDSAAVGEGAVAKEETAEEVVAVAKPTLTDKLNQRLLMSFLERINDPSSGIPTYVETRQLKNNTKAPI